MTDRVKLVLSGMVLFGSFAGVVITGLVAQDVAKISPHAARTAMFVCGMCTCGFVGALGFFVVAALSL